MWLKLMDQVKKAADDALDQFQSNGFHLDQTVRTRKSRENCAKKQERQFLPFSKHSAAIHKPWAPWLIKTNSNLSEAYSMWSREHYGTRCNGRVKRLVSVWLQCSGFSIPMWFTWDFWLGTIPLLTLKRIIFSHLSLLRSCAVSQE